MDEICCECYQKLVFSPNLTFKTCLKCHKSVCIICQTKHENTKDHSFGFYHFPHLSNFCLEHKRELLKKYCVNCRTAVCSSCYRKWHEGHKTVSLSEVATDSKQNLKKEKDSIQRELRKVIQETEKGQEIYTDFALKLKYIYQDVDRILYEIRQRQAEILNYASYGINKDIDFFLNEMLSLTIRQRVGYERYRILTKIEKEKDSYKYLSFYQYYQSWLQQCVVIPKADSPQLQALNVRHRKPSVEEVKNLLLNIEIGSKFKEKSKSSGDNNEEEKTKKLQALYAKDKIVADHQKEIQKRDDEIRCSRKAMQFMNENLMRSKISNASMKMKMLENISDYPQVMETILEFQRNMEDIKHHMNKKDMLISQLEKEIEGFKHASKQGVPAGNKKGQEDEIRVEEQSELNNKLEDLENILQLANKENEQLRHNVEKSEYRIEELQASYDKLHKQHLIVKQNLDMTNRESEDLKTRLSQVAGAKLVAGNSCIADLGDKYRPTKISEMFSELYDTEWTDAIDKLMSSNKDWSEDLAVRHLFIVLQVCYRTCSDLAKRQLNSICKILFLDIPSEQMTEKLDRYVTEVKQIRDARKGLARDVSQFLIGEIFGYDQFKRECKKYKELDQELLFHIRKTEFIEKCVMVCWLMVVQDPEVFIDDDMSPGERFNKDIYREYTQSGTKIAFSVWPALYLKKGGPLLSKGVVQVTN